MPPRPDPHPTARRRRCALVALLLPLAVASAQSSGGGYTLRKHVISGGAAVAGGGFGGPLTSHQVVAGFAQGGRYRVTAGFHGPGGPAAAERVFCDGFEPAPCP